MTISHEFEYFKPESIDEATAILSKYNSEASILAGGTDLINSLKEDLSTPQVLIDIKGLKELTEIRYEKKKLSIGSLVTFSELIKSEIITKNFPIISEMAAKVASNGVRHRATMVGNICSAVPCADSAPVLTIYEAEIHLTSKSGKRVVKIDNWFVGPKKTSRKPDEFVTKVVISDPGKHGGAFVKLGRYKGEDLAQASVAILTDGKNYKISFGSVAPIPIRAFEIEKILNGKILDDSIIKKIKEKALELISPITDIRATKEYRAHMIQIMLERGLKASIERYSGKAKYGEDLI